MSPIHPRVLVLWADRDSTNLGLRALAEGTHAIVTRRWPDAQVTFHTQGSPGTPLSKRAVLGDIFRSHGPIKTELASYDVVLDTGAGDSFTDIYGLRRLLLMSYVQHVATKVGVPAVLLPQTIGPFDSRLGRLLAKRSLRHATAVFARDPVSAAYAKELGRASTAESTDLVFAIDRPDLAASPQRDVVVNVSGLLWSENPHVDHGEYRAAVAQLIDGLLARGRTVSLLAHVLDSEVVDNDVPAVREAAEGHGDRVEVLIPESLDEVRSILAGATAVVGARMHACLNSLSVGTPAISWAYSRKFAPLMNALGWNMHVDLRTSEDPATETLALLDSLDASDAAAQVRKLLTRTDSMMDDLVDTLGHVGAHQTRL
ncbi:MAG: polysaccharide pyruvyl transferase family protein [Rhodococcus sp. (in: high G+C Gram-positive bacteria)]|uniref:polysaccharide pyruvyl transferase family protein n=1 Tax=Rhodococcus sp. TaxID=1831 RepID=UPI003BB068EF